jgi:hypothetical protein
MKKTASMANIKPVIAAPAMAAATWLVPTPDEPKDDRDELPAVLPLVPCDEGGKLLADVRVPTAAPGAMDTGLLLDDTGTGIMTTDWFVGGGGDAEEEEDGGLREGWEFVD